MIIRISILFKRINISKKKQQRNNVLISGTEIIIRKKRNENSLKRNSIRVNEKKRSHFSKWARTLRHTKPYYFCLSCLGHLVFMHALKNFYIIWISNILVLTVPDERFSRWFTKEIIKGFLIPFIIILRNQPFVQWT